MLFVRKVKKKCSTLFNFFTLAIFIACIFGCVFEIGRALHKLLQWEMGTNVQIIPMDEAQDIRKNIRFALCISGSRRIFYDIGKCGNGTYEYGNIIQPACDFQLIAKCLKE